MLRVRTERERGLFLVFRVRFAWCPRSVRDFVRRGGVAGLIRACFVFVVAHGWEIAFVLFSVSRNVTRLNLGKD